MDSKVCALVFFLTSSHTLSALETSMQDSCDLDWLEFDGSCYLYVQQFNNWNDASSHCRSYEATLPVITSAEENSFIKDIIDATVWSIWTDGQDSEVEGVWKWKSNDRLVDFTDFQPGEPNERTHADCLGMFYPYGFRWDDYYCTDSARYSVCEKPKCKKYFINKEEAARHVQYKASSVDENVVPKTHILWTIFVSLFQCAEVCTYDNMCSSFFYNEESHICYGYENAVLLVDETVVSNGTKRYTMDKCVVI